MKKEKQILNALREIENFKGDDLNLKLKEISDNCIGKSSKDIRAYNDLYNAALIIKRASAQINEMVHAFGILNCLPKILQKDEKVESLSLASGATGEGIDLVTSHRIAEFKFSNWQDGSSNGMRKRQVFADLVSLYLNDTNKKKRIICIWEEAY